MSEYFGPKKENQMSDTSDPRLQELKQIIDTLGAGADPKEVKKQFAELIRNADAYEVAALEQSLIQQGMSVQEVLRLCDVHADVFKEGLEQGKQPNQLPGHPIQTYKQENKAARTYRNKLVAASLFGNGSALQKATTQIMPIVRHYQRKENQLFPYLEQKGFTGPSKVMWGKHDEIRQTLKDLQAAIQSNQIKQARKLARIAAKKITTMIFMEEKILFPNALKLLSEPEWAQVRMGEHAIGFAWIQPGSQWDPVLALGLNPAAQAEQTAHIPQNRDQSHAISDVSIPLSVGSLPLDILDKILCSLPIDVSFVDHEDKVLYYSDSPHRVFPRSPGIIGRDVHNCHPQKSLSQVEKILTSFKNKEKDRADFWIQMGPKFVVISYKPIYDENGTYRGTLEMSWDAAEVRALEGERRLLDW